MSPQAGYILQEEIIPRLYGAVHRSVKCVGAEYPEELVHDGIVIAAKMMHSNESKRKQVPASMVAYFTIQKLKSGRRASGQRSVDVMGSATQLNGTSRLHSLHEVVSQVDGEEIFEMHDVISNDHEDPGVQAARRMDWSAFLMRLSRKERKLIQCVYAEKTQKEIVRIVKLTREKIVKLLHQIRVKILEFMGADILKDIARVPGWKINLICEREAVLCRHDRSA